MLTINIHENSLHLAAVTRKIFHNSGENVLSALHLTMLCHLYGLQRSCKIPSPAFSLTVNRSYSSFEPDLAASHPFFVVSPILLADYPLQQRTLHSMPGQHHCCIPPLAYFSVLLRTNLM